jgi:5'-nucleotidase
MRILIANDDGIYSPGLATLAQAAMRFGEVRIVAPDVEQSSMGQAITHARPLALRHTTVPGVPKDAWRVNGTPADCVALGIAMGEVDLVLSGVNLGANLGNSMWHSGTLAAAKQGALLGRRGIALSTPMESEEPSFGPLEPWIEKVLALLIPMKELALINVNVPAAPKGIVWTRQSVRHYDGKVVAAKDPRGRQLHWITVVPIEETEEGTDRWAVSRGYISITPLRLDLTDEKALAAHRARPSTGA